MTSITSSSFSANNTLSAIDNHRIVSFSSPFNYLMSIADYSDSISGEQSSAIVQRSMRWSNDGDSWSLWINFSPSDLTPITGLSFSSDTPTYLEFRFKLVSPDTASPQLPTGTEISPAVVVSGFDITLSYKDNDPGSGKFKRITRCSDEFCALPVIIRDKYTFDPYAVNSALCLYKDLSKMVNLMFGHEIFYWRVRPQHRSQDIVYKEWTLFNVETHRCIKVMVPNNEFPDSKPTFVDSGINFEVPFEVHIDRAYFENYFGKYSMPQQRDIVYFPLLNRMYEVASSYLYRDFMQQGVYYKVSLIKYQQRADQIMPDDVAENIDSLTISTEELFGEQLADQTERITKPQQYRTITHENDPARQLVHRRLPIVRYNLDNNWTVLSEYFYDMNSLYSEEGPVMAVQWRATANMGPADSRSYLCWFEIDADEVDPTNQVRNLLSSGPQGINIDLIYSSTASAVRVRVNGAEYTLQLGGVVPAGDTWYGLVVNISNKFGQVGAYLWGMQSGTSELKLLASKSETFSSQAVNIPTNYYISASAIGITNIRLFDSMVEEEQMSLVLTQMIVKDAHRALFIDNARPLLRLAVQANPK